jgi:hypothetical protein
MSENDNTENTGAESPKAVSTRAWWFKNLPSSDQDRIIRPHFEEAHPTGDDIRRAVKRYDSRTT